MFINELPKNAQPPMLRFETDMEFHKALSENEHAIHVRTFKAIQYAIEIGYEDEITIAFLNDEDTILGCPQEAWADNLEMSMEYFISIEDYERCTEIKQLIAKIS